LDETIWSLTSPRVKRIRRLQEFSFTTPKRLLQQYLPNPDITFVVIAKEKPPEGGPRGRDKR
jgi:hypothetical protein